MHRFNFLNFNWFNSVAITFGLVHFFIAIAIYFGGFEGSWGYYFLALPDFPVTIFLILLKDILSFNLTWIILTIFGSLWWYFLGHLLSYLLGKNKNPRN